MKDATQTLLELEAISAMVKPRQRERPPMKQCIRSKDSPVNKKNKKCKYAGGCGGYKNHCKFKLH